MASPGFASSRAAFAISGPIAALVKGAEEVSKGHLQYRINTPAIDELVGLIKSFNQMTQDLETNSRELETRRRFTEAILESIERGVPFLGICVGMQWMLASSEEAPEISGLALWPGECSRFPAAVKSPHVGWNSLQIRNGSRLLQGVPSGSFVYFTHSYRVPLLTATAAECEYGGGFSAVVEQENMFGVQFHPEKSGVVGLTILKNFCNL